MQRKTVDNLLDKFEQLGKEMSMIKKAGHKELSITENMKMWRDMIGYVPKGYATQRYIFFVTSLFNCNDDKMKQEKVSDNF